MDYDFYSGEDEDSPKIPSLLPTHLDSPVRIHVLQAIKNNIKLLNSSQPVPKNLNPGIKHVVYDLRSLMKDHPSIPSFSIMDASCFNAIKSELAPISSCVTFSQMLEKRVQVALRNVELQYCPIEADLPRSGEPDNGDLTPNLTESLHVLLENSVMVSKSLPFIIKHYYWWYCILHQAVIITGTHHLSNSTRWEGQKPEWVRNRDGREIWTLSAERISMSVSRNMFLLKTKSGEIIVGTRDHLLMIADIFLQRFNLSLSGFIGEKIGFNHYLSHEELYQLHSWGDQILSMTKNHAFDILSKWEPVCTGIMLKYTTDLLKRSKDFLGNIVASVIDESSHMIPDIQLRLAQLEELLLKLFKKNTHKVSQAFGIFRTWGHPNIDPREGIVKLKQIACQRKVINRQKTKEIACIFKEQFCLNYRAKKGFWPKLDVTRLSTFNVIRRAYETNSCLSLVTKFYNRQDWSLVSFDSTFVLSDKLNISNLISDKALSLGIDELVEQINKHNNIGLATDKAVIVQWLKSQLNDPIKFLSDIDANGFGQEETVFGLCPKEREMKIIARFFGLSTLKKRMYIVLTEAIIAEYIVPYFPQITMMDSSLTLSKKFYDKTRDMADLDKEGIRRTVNAVINIDFQKWNSFMREEETKEIFSSMDALFGFRNCIARTHEMFTKSQMYLADGTVIPKTVVNSDGTACLENSDFVWEGHLGGVEGLRQKGWTIFTVCILIDVMSKFPHKFSLMGQGDNQVLIIHFDSKASENYINEEMDRILDRMDQVLKLVGPPLKKEETWVSTSLFIYGKFIILNGCPRSMSQKKMCRMFPMSNEGFPTTETALSSVVANGSAACASDFNPLVPFFMQSFWMVSIIHNMLTYSYLGFSVPDLIKGLKSVRFLVPGFPSPTEVKFGLQDDKIRAVSTKDNNLLLALCIFPKVLGGFPIGFLCQNLVKGFPDPVTECLAIIKSFYPNLNRQEHFYVNNFLSPQINPQLNLEYLFSNPAGLNLLVPTTPGDIVKSSVTRFIQAADWIVNPYVNTFISMADKDQKDLTEALAEMTPLNPIIAHSILESTLVGRAKQVMEQLNKTGTLVKIAAKEGDNLLGRVTKSETNYINSVIYSIFYKGNLNINILDCSRKNAQLMRETTWKRPDITGVTVPYPFECFKMTSGMHCQDHPNPEKGYILIKETTTLPLKSWMRGERIGESVPYLGSRTHDKVQSYGKQVASFSAPLLKKCAQLQSLIGWATERDSNLSRCIRTILESVTDLSPELLTPSDAEISGSVEHRLATTAISRGGNVEMVFTFGTFLSIATDTLIAYSKGTANVNLHFQACMSWVVSIFSMMKSMGYGPSIKFGHYHQRCLDCIIAINETKVEVPHREWGTLILSNPSSPFCWIPKEHALLQASRGALQYEIMPSNHKYKQDPNWMQLRGCRLAARETIKRVRQLSLEIGDGKASSRSGWLFPVAWVWKVNPYVFFCCFVFEMFSYFLFRQFENKMREITFHQCLDEFEVFLSRIPASVMGIFSSWFQHPSFMDFISGPPLFIRPPLQSSLSRNSCGSCVKGILLKLTTMLFRGEASTELFEGWKVFTSGGEEAMDSSPLLLSVVYQTAIEGRNITNSDNLIVYLAIKEVLPHFSRSSEFLNQNLKICLKNNVGLLRKHMDSEDIQAFLKFVDSLSLFQCTETADGVISSLPKHEVTVTLDPIKKINPSSLPAVSHIEHLVPSYWEMSFGSLIKDEDILLDLPAVSLENHLYKPESFPTTAMYKLLSILQASGHLGTTENAGCFGDGAGGFTKLLLSCYPFKVFYNSLIEVSKLFPNALGNYYPPALAGSPELRERLIGLKFTYEVISDLTDHSYAQQYITQVGIKLDLMICDAEGGGITDMEKSPHMLINLCNVANWSKTSLLIFKTYYSNWSNFKNLLVIMLHYFSHVKIARSYFSSKGSSEVYIMGHGAREATRPVDPDKLWETKFGSKICANQEFMFKKKLLKWSLITPREDDANKYTNALSSSTSGQHVQATLKSVSQSLPCYVYDKHDPDSAPKYPFHFPYTYIADCRKSTHFLRFNEKYAKITKTCYITSTYAQRVLVGYLAMLTLHPDFTIEKFNWIIEMGGLVFYPVHNHLWSFTVCRYSLLIPFRYPKFSLRALINSKVKKEILSKGAILRQVTGIKISFLNSINEFLESKLIFDRVSYKFHWGCTPSYFSSDMDFNYKVLGTPKFDKVAEKWLERLKQVWFRTPNVIRADPSLWVNL